MTGAPAAAVTRSSTSHQSWPARLLVVALCTLAVIFGGDPRPAIAAPLVIPAAGAAVPLSVVSAAVGGGVSVISTGAALASAGITAAAVFAANRVVDALFSWSPDAPADFGDVTTTAYNEGKWSGDYVNNCRGYNTLVGSSTDQACVYAEGKSGDTTGKALTSSTTAADTFRPQCHSPGTYGTAVAAGSAVDYATCGTHGVRAVQWLRDGANADHYNLSTTAPTTSSTTEPGTTPLSVTPTTRCVDGAGTVQAFAGTILKTTRSTADPQRLTFPSCPAGSALKDRSAPITRDADGALQGDAVTGETGTSTPWTPPVVPLDYPDCADRLCVMTLTQTAPSGDVVSCNATPSLCGSYADVVKTWPQTGTAAPATARPDKQGNNYACKFGPYPVAVAECQVIPGVGVVVPEVDNRCDWELTRPWTWPWTALKCAFVPSPQGMTRWQTRVDVIKARPPANVIDAGITVVHEGVAEVQCAAETPTGSCSGWTIPTFRVMPEAGTHEVDVVQAAGDRVQDLWGGRLYLLVQAGIVVAGALLIWQRISQSFGGKD